MHSGVAMDGRVALTRRWIALAFLLVVALPRSD